MLVGGNSSVLTFTAMGDIIRKNDGKRERLVM